MPPNVEAAYEKYRHMRVALFLAMMILLGGCLPEKSKDADACRNEADRFFQGYQTDDVNNPRSRYIIECMASKGYAFDISPTNCDSRRSLPTQPACYAATGWLAQLIDLLPGH